jgi:NAD(P)H dehydrogenase (quinone)
MGASPSSPFAPMPAHAATEAALQESGVPFTSLRSGFYATTVAMLLGPALQTGELAVAEGGPVAWTTHADLADAAVLALADDAALTDDAALDGLTPALTGPEAIDAAGIAAIATRLAGRPIRRVVVSDADYRAGLVAQGLPEWRADILVGIFAASRQGEFAPAGPTLARLLGRPTTPLTDFLKTTITPAS